MTSYTRARHKYVDWKLGADEMLTAQKKKKARESIQKEINAISGGKSAEF